MEIYIIGTSAAIPSYGRNLPAILLRREDENLLFDCGDGTQLHLVNSPYKISRIKKIFISHLHGDHVFGLPGLVSTIFFQNTESSISIFGPKELKNLLQLMDNFEQVQRKIRFYATEDGVCYEDDAYQIISAPLNHHIDCFGYAIIEKPKAGKLNVEKLNSMGIPSGPIYGQLKKGKDVTLKNGEKLLAKDFIGEPTQGKKVVYCTDTKATPNLYNLSKNADVFICESTFAADLKETAENYHHLTAKQAINIAVKSKVKKLILTHFSSRYRKNIEILKDLDLPSDLEIILAEEKMLIQV